MSDPIETRNPAPTSPGDIVLENGASLNTLANVFYKSGYFRDLKSVHQAAVKILAGQEMGISPVQSIRHIHMWDGNIQTGYQIIGANIKRSGRYDYRVRHLDETRAVIEFYDGAESVGESEFSIESAKKQGLTGKPNWQRQPKIMLFARALTQGANMFCPDVHGGPVYAEGDSFDAAPEPVSVTVVEDADTEPEAQAIEDRAAVPRDRDETNEVLTMLRAALEERKLWEKRQGILLPFLSRLIKRDGKGPKLTFDPPVCNISEPDLRDLMREVHKHPIVDEEPPF